MLAGFGNPIEYIFNVGKLEQGILSVENTIPYTDIEHMDDSEVYEECCRYAQEEESETEMLTSVPMLDKADCAESNH